MSNNLVLVIGGTGAQGAVVVEHLVKDKKYTARVLTRNPNSRRAQDLAKLGNVEFITGDMTNEDDLVRAFEGVGLAFVNTDGFALGEQAELFWGMRIYELAVQAKTVRHYVWGSLDYATLKGGYDKKYRTGHYDGKGRVTQWLLAQQQPSHMIRSVLTSGPYMDMLYELMLPIEKDGVFLFAAPIGDGSIPLIALDDLGYYARYVFDNPEKNAGVNLEVATEEVSWQHLVSTFIEVTGKPAKFIDLSMEAYMSHFDEKFRIGGTGMRFVDNFRGFWNMWHDKIIKRDYEMLYKIHPNHLTLKTWMIKNKYEGRAQSVLKIVEDGWAPKKHAQ